MNWNYRILDHGSHLSLHEVYYDDAGRITDWTAEPITFTADGDEDAEALKSALANALSDARQYPVLSVEELDAALASEGGSPAGQDAGAGRGKVVRDDPFLGHEALDRADLLARMWQDFLTGHPYVAADEGLRERAAHIADLMGDFYQAVGALTLDLTPKPG